MWFGSGFIIQIIYAAGGGNALPPINNALLTEDGRELLITFGGADTGNIITTQ